MIVEYIASHQAQFWLLLGFAMLAIEVITGFVSGVFLFAGLAATTAVSLVIYNRWITKTAQSKSR